MSPVLQTAQVILFCLMFGVGVAMAYFVFDEWWERKWYRGGDIPPKAQVKVAKRQHEAWNED